MEDNAGKTISIKITTDIVKTMKGSSDTIAILIELLAQTL
jgi:hypothetical protein